MNRRGISRRVLAMNFARRRAWLANCRRSAALWTRAEAAWAVATSEEEAAAAAAPALAKCQGCPLLRSGECFEWAETDHYYGLAAGLSWVDGTPRTAKYGPAVDQRAG